MFFNASRSKPSAPLCRPLEEQEERESQKLWAQTSQAVKDRDHVLATDEKTKVEDMQREEAAVRANDGVEWRPRLFRRVKGGPGGSEEGEEDLEWIINAQMLVTCLVCSCFWNSLLMLFVCLSQRRKHPRETGSTGHGDLPHCERAAAQEENLDTP